jgi:hypothetical protein
MYFVNFFMKKRRGSVDKAARVIAFCRGSVLGKIFFQCVGGPVGITVIFSPPRPCLSTYIFKNKIKLMYDTFPRARLGQVFKLERYSNYICPAKTFIAL